MYNIRLTPDRDVRAEKIRIGKMDTESSADNHGDCVIGYVPVTHHP